MQHIDVSIGNDFPSWSILWSNNVLIVYLAFEQNWLHARMIRWSETFLLQADQMRKYSASHVVIVVGESPQYRTTIFRRLTKILMPRMIDFSILNPKDVNKVGAWLAPTQRPDFVHNIISSYLVGCLLIQIFSKHICCLFHTKSFQISRFPP